MGWERGEAGPGPESRWWQQIWASAGSSAGLESGSEFSSRECGRDPGPQSQQQSSVELMSEQSHEYRLQGLRVSPPSPHIACGRGGTHRAFGDSGSGAAGQDAGALQADRSPSLWLQCPGCRPRAPASSLAKHLPLLLVISPHSFFSDSCAHLFSKGLISS